MINTYVIQEFCKEKPSGFALKSDGGTVRHIEYRLLRDGIEVSRRDIMDSLHYMLETGLLVEMGQYGNDTLYKVVVPE